MPSKPSDSLHIGEIRNVAERPKYQRVRDYFVSEIRSGRFTPGQALPSEAKLVQSLKISRNTVRQALAELEQDGVIHRVQGSGTFVSTEQQKSIRQQLNVLAFVAPEMQTGLYPVFLQGFQKGCVRCQYQTIVGYSGNDINKQAELFIQLIDQSVGGVALVPTTTPVTPAHHIRLLHKHNIPVVLCHRTVADVVTPSVVFSGHEVGFKAGQLMINQGHRKIAYLYYKSYSMFEAYGRGLRDAMSEAGHDPANIVTIEYGANLSAAEADPELALTRTLSTLLTQKDRPSAIFCGHLLDSEVVYLQAKKYGISIPKDMSLMTFGPSTRDRGLASEISGVSINEHDLGATAAQLLFEMRTGKRQLDNDEQITFPIMEQPGATLGPAVNS